MANILSYKQVTNLLEDIGRRHNQINTVFEGMNWDVENNQDVVYPLFQFYPELAVLPQTNGEYKTIEVTLNCKILDLVKPDKTNVIDVDNDTLRIAQDVINEINQHPFYLRSNVQLVGDIELTSLENYEDDITNGWEFRVKLKMINTNSYCGLPFEEITGYSASGPVSTGYSYSVQYMPTSGGIFTGAITGTCGYFSCFNSTSLSGNSIYLSGVSLLDTFLSINSAISSATTAVQNGLNTYTGGTILFPTVNISGGTFDNLFVTGVTSVSALTANTFVIQTGSTKFLSTTESGEFNFSNGNGTGSQIAIHQDSFNRTRILDLYNNSYAKSLLVITDNGSAGQVVIGDNAVTIDTYSHNIGIGIGSAASTKLRLKGDASTGDILAVSPFGGGGGVYFTNDVGNNPFFYLQNSAGTSTQVAIRSYGTSYFNGGNVGIGTLNAQEYLHINGGTIRINDAGSTYGAGKIAISDANGSISFSSATVLGYGVAIQNGTNTYTGGTQLAPTVNVSALTINTLTASGNSAFQILSATSVSASTISGGTVTVNSVVAAGNIQAGATVFGNQGQFNSVQPFSSGLINLTLQTRPASSADIVFKTSGTTPNETMRITSAGTVVVSGTTVLYDGFSAFTNSVSGVSVFHTSGGTPVISVNTTNGRVGIKSASPTNTLEVGGNISAGASIVAGSVGGYYINTNKVIEQGPTGYNSNAMVFGNPSTAAALTVFSPVPLGIATSGNTLRNLFTISQASVGNGTIAGTSGITTVTGTGTSFLTFFNAGDTVRIGSVLYTIASIQSDTLLTLTTTATTTNSTGVYQLANTGERFTVGGNGNVRSSSNNISGFTIVNQTGGTPVFNVDTKNLVTSATTVALSNRIYNAINPLQITSATTINWASNNVFDYTLTANTTFTFSNVQAGQTLIVAVRQPSTGATGFNYAFTGSTVNWSNATSPTVTTTTGKTDIYTFIALSASSVYGSAITNF